MSLPNRARAVTLAVVVAGAVAFAGMSAVRANPEPSLPSVAPADLLASSLSALSRPFSVKGDVITQANLGLPEIPSSLGATSLGAASFLVGEQHFKVWRSPDGVRLAHIVDFGEQDVVTDRTDAWLWDSASMTAAHLSLAQLNAGGSWAQTPAQVGDPMALAKQALDAVAPYAFVTVDGTARVAGLPVYQLTLTPRSSLSRVGRIVVAIDAQTRLPLRFQVFPRGGLKPALESAFTSVSFGQIPASTFEFKPPSGVKVTQVNPSKFPGRWGGDASAPSPFDQVRTFGSGFDIRWAVRLDAPVPAEASAFLPYDGPLGSALLVQHNGATWLLAGFVDLQTLRTDAGQLP